MKAIGLAGGEGWDKEEGEKGKGREGGKHTSTSFLQHPPPEFDLSRNKPVWLMVRRDTLLNLHDIGL
jgi:hypothetical protein